MTPSRIILASAGLVTATVMAVPADAQSPQVLKFRQECWLQNGVADPSRSRYANQLLPTVKECVARKMAAAGVGSKAPRR
jgi:hypothetical protein